MSSSSRSRIGIFAGLISMIVSSLILVDGLVFAGEPTDLPFFGERSVTCSNTWHHACRDGSTDRAGMDFDVPVGVPLYATGHGKINRYGDQGDIGYGQYVEMHFSSKVHDVVVAHMSHRFTGALLGEEVCLFTPLGYSGNSGNSSGPHVHLESDSWIGVSPKPTAQYFTPIYGLRSTDDKITKTELEGASTVDHDCGPGGCANHTAAYMVDDVQVGDFSFAPSSFWSRVTGSGMGYASSSSATHRATQYSDDPVRTATWSQKLRPIDNRWKVFAYIPNIARAGNVAREVEYEVSRWVQAPGGPWELASSKHTIRQDEHRGKWVQIGGTFPTFFSSPTPRLKVMVSSRRMPGDCAAPGTCGSRRVLADAVIFMPENCES